MPYKDKEKLKEYKKQYQIDNKKRLNKISRLWRINNLEYYKEYKRQYYEDNCEYIKDKSKKYREDNPEYNNVYSKKWNIEKRKTDLRFNLNCRIRTAINISIRGSKAGRHWEDLTGYNLDDLIKRLNNTMPEGYTWKDFLNGKLHLDHIIPVSAFNFTRATHTDFKRCWALSNLRLLPAEENLIKSNHLEKPFQPALKI